MAREHRILQGPYQGGYYQVSGHGSPVLLVHGFPLDGSVWDIQSRTLESGFQVIVPDLPGSGRSLSPTGSGSFEAMAGFLHDILGDLQVTSCVIIGHSMGGYISLALMDKYPEMVRGLGLLHAGSWPDNAEKISSRLEAIADMEKNGSAPFLGRILPGLFTEKYRKENPAIMASLLDHAADLEPQTLVNYYQAMMDRPDRTLMLQQSPVPVLFIAGRKDMISPPDQLEALAQLPRVSSFYILEETAHMGMLEAPQELSQVIADFAGFCFNHLIT